MPRSSEISAEVEAAGNYCLGANLTKREIRVLLTELLARVDDIALDATPGTDPVTWSVPGLAVPVGLGIGTLPIRYRPRR